TDAAVDFDLEAVKQRTMENPVYYVQYAHARIKAVLRRAADAGVVLPERSSLEGLSGLDTQDDMLLLRKLALFQDMVETAARTLNVHHVSHYLMELAQLLHSYYAKYPILKAETKALACARLALLRAAAQAVASGLALMGVSAPEHM
ncbi:MAG: arginine--tRNA ligase, partial [Desulfovibrio sp.]|nr:arginine--tRNA ligase [Desulfovibrio sp.]